jgi:hypothetical protein
MHFRHLLLLVLFPASLLAQTDSLLSLPENLRARALGGAFVAVADDPQAGFLNPAGIDRQSRLGFDLSLTEATSHGVDQITTAYLNPQSDNNTAFAFGTWSQGLTRPHDHIYYVPYIGTRWRIASTTGVGLVVRSPYRKASHGTDKSQFGAVLDASLMQKAGPLQFGALLERAMGGSMNFVPRNLRAGAAIIPSSQFLLSYEWRGDQIGSRYNFHYSSSHAGAELRGGFAWEETNRIAFGTGIGMLEHGWQVSAAWEIPAKGKGLTVWSVGLSYRL